MEYVHEKYDEFIQNIINTRGQGNIPKDEYFETHHIVPECMGGTPPKPVTKLIHKNLIGLYPREHYEAHRILAEENPNNYRLVSAYGRMVSQTTKKGHLILTPEEYEVAKLDGVSITRASHIGGHLSDETKEKISESEKGKVVSIETRKKLSESGKGKEPGNKGKKLPYKSRPSRQGILPGCQGLTKETSPSVALLGKKSGEFRKGKKFTPEHVKNSANAHKKPVMCIETGEIFECATDAIDKMGLNIPKNAIGYVCRGQRDIAAGYHGKYIEKGTKGE